METKLSEKVAHYWLDTIRTIPTRSLQLSFEVAMSKYDQLTDFSIILAILRNNPSIVKKELIDKISNISEYIKSNRAHIKAKKVKEGKNPYSATIDPFKWILEKYFAEKKLGIHQYNPNQDYSSDLVSSWVSNRKNANKEDIFVFGNADYLRIVARTIEYLPNKIWQSAFGGIHIPSIVTSLGGQKGFNKKEISKLLKKLSSVMSHLN